MVTAQLNIAGESYDLPVIVGTENEHAVDVRALRKETGYISFDDGYANTGACESQVTYIDGEQGILRYRGYPIEELCAKSSFLETAYLVIYGELPNEAELSQFRKKIRDNMHIHTGMQSLYSGFPDSAHPMAELSSMLNTLGCYYPEMASNDREKDLESFDDAAAVLIAKVTTIAAMTYRSKQGLPFNFPNPNLRYVENYLHLMFSLPHEKHEANPDLVRALDLFLILHADHEQNCSTSTVRMVASGGANMFASASAGVCALWGPLHGGANMAVIKMLEQIHASGDDGSKFIEGAKNGQERLMGFGHRVYKNFDPRAKILGEACEKMLESMGTKDPLLDIANRLKDAALNDEYFVKRKLYPNVDFYSGIILKAAGIPVEMFTVMFAIGRMPGWLAHWKEIAANPKGRIHRPRQIYTGSAIREFKSIEER